MKTEELEELFKSRNFDISEPVEDHQQRFLEKLKLRGSSKIKTFKIIPFWIPMSAIAASLIMGFLLFQGNFILPIENHGELASVSPEMTETQNFYSSVIRKELAQLEEQNTPKTKALISDALNQLKILETDYEKLKLDLVKSGQDNRVIYAMINNFQKRIDLLNKIVEKVNSINTL